MPIINSNISSIPSFFQRLMRSGHILKDEVVYSKDGFSAVTKSIAAILISNGIETFPGNQNQVLESRNYFDDWYLYAVPCTDGHIYSLFKMREQEHDAEIGLDADNDTPGVTISFVALDIAILEQCLLAPECTNRKMLAVEINRVVAYRRQVHHPDIKAYFLRPEAEGSYLVADLYTKKIASFASDGILDVPAAYAKQYRKRYASDKYSRLPDFLDSNNATAGRTVCDHDRIYIQDPVQLTIHEKLAILATHTANTSFHSFAAEVRYHAKFLVWYAKVTLPFVGSSPYASAVRADMTIDDKEFEGPAPFYDENSALFLEQMKCHTDW